MGILKKTCLFMLLVVCSGLCFAKQISFQVVQHDESLKTVGEQSLIIEDEILTGLFNCGYIVTNSVAAVSSSDGNDEKLWKLGLNEAFDGYSDYFVQINLFFTSPKEGSKGAAKLEKVYWSISNAKTGSILAEKKVSASNAVNADDLRAISAVLVTDINKIVKENKA